MKSTINHQPSTHWKNFLCGSLFILAFGCESDTNFSQSPLEGNLKKSESYLVSEDLAKQIAAGFFKSDSSFIAARKGRATPKIKQVARVVLPDIGDFEAYVINEAEGFVIIAGDTRIMPILAYSSEGELKPEDFEEVIGPYGSTSTYNNDLLMITGLR